MVKNSHNGYAVRSKKLFYVVNMVRVINLADGSNSLINWSSHKVLQNANISLNKYRYYCKSITIIVFRNRFVLYNVNMY